MDFRVQKASQRVEDELGRAVLKWSKPFFCFVVLGECCVVASAVRLEYGL